MAAASHRHAARSTFQSVSEPSTEYLHLFVILGGCSAESRSGRSVSSARLLSGVTGAPGLGECVPAARPERGWQDRRHRPEQAADPRRPVSSARPGPGLRWVYRRRIHRQGREPDPARRLRHSAGRLRPQETPRQGPRGQARPTRRYHVPPDAARTIAALLALCHHVIAPILAGSVAPASAASPRPGPPSTATTRSSASPCRPCSGTSVSRPGPQPHRQHCVHRSNASWVTQAG